MPKRHISAIEITQTWRLPGAILLFGCFLMSACTTVTTQSFRVNQNPDIDSSYIAIDAEFGKYELLLADEMGIFFPPNTPLSGNELARIRQIFRESFLAELQGYTIVETPGPSTLKVQASLIDLRNSASSEMPGLRREVQAIAKPGALLFLMELRDSESDRVLGRAADSAATPDFASSVSDVTDWGSVEAAAQHWAALFRRFLDQNLNQ